MGAVLGSGRCSRRPLWWDCFYPFVLWHGGRQTGLGWIGLRPAQLSLWGGGEPFEKVVGSLVLYAGEEMDFEGVMGGFGRKTCKKEKGMEDHIEGGV